MKLGRDRREISDVDRAVLKLAQLLTQSNTDLQTAAVSRKVELARVEQMARRQIDMLNRVRAILQQNRRT